MNQLMRRITFLLVLVFAVASTACGSLNTEAKGPVPAGPPEGKARIYFALNQGFPSGNGYVLEGTKLLGYLQNNQHFVVDVPAGEHLFMLVSSTDEALQGNFEAGKTYHIKLFVTPGVFGVTTYWVPLESSGEDVVSAKEALAETQRVELIPKAAAKWEADEKEDMQERHNSFKSGEDDIGHTIEVKHAH